ncbi:MAG: hypothetical protein QOK17_2432 [Sphingomonadales bacterium]|jgi:hypothetical protein|nr:hypothetical protein [Sphingomonadales bacterium]
MVRAFILAALTWLILGTAPQNVSGDANRLEAKVQRDLQTAAAKTALSAKPYQKAHDPNPPCEKGEDNRRSDLCAQWKAADAADFAANVAYWIGLGGILVAALTLAAAVAAALYARNAALETGKGAEAARNAVEAARDANRITRNAQMSERMAARAAAADARRDREIADKRAEAAYSIAKRNAELVGEQVALAKEAAERQLRAYLSVNKGFAYGMNPQRQPTFGIVIKNQGQTPAYRVKIYSVLNWTTDAPEDVDVHFTEPFTKVGTLTGGEEWVYKSETAGQPWPPNLYTAVTSKQAILVYSGVIVYWDAFRKRRLTTFKAYLKIDNIVDDNAGLTLATRGNHSN